MTAGANEQKEISELTRNTQKSAKTNREKNVMNESERNYVSGEILRDVFVSGMRANFGVNYFVDI